MHSLDISTLSPEAYTVHMGTTQTGPKSTYCVHNIAITLYVSCSPDAKLTNWNVVLWYYVTTTRFFASCHLVAFLINYAYIVARP